MKPDPPDKSVPPDHPTARPQTLIWMDTNLLFYIFSGFGRVMDYPFFVRYPPDSPNTYIKIKSNPTSSHFFLSLTYFLLPPPSLLASFAPSLFRSHASIAPMPPSRRHSLMASFLHGVSSSISHLTAHSHTTSLHQSLTLQLTPIDPSLPHGLTPSNPSLPSRPHLLRSMPPLRFGWWFWFCF